jgi:GGDEF domain-containing protein
MSNGRRSGSLVAIAAAAAGAVSWRAHRAALERLHRAIAREREASRRLTNELHAKHESTKPMGDGDEVRDLVLRTAIGLLGAEKGVLLSRSDADGDGDFDMVSAHGFRADPEHNPIVQRFTGDVLQRDEMVREDEVRGDAEIRNLVAVPVYLFDHFHGVVVCANRAGGFRDVQDDVLLALGDHAGAALHTERLHRSLRDVHRGAVRMLSELVAARDPALGDGAAEAVTLAAAMARRLGMDGRERDVVVCAAALRNAGTLAVPERILAKAGPLTAAERAVVERHAEIGFDVIGQIPEMRDIAFGVLYHHERHDGDGYPAGLAGDAIPRPARVVAIVEAFCAMTRDRPHQPARPAAAAVRELIDHAGTQFDPELVAVFVEEVERPQLRSLDAGTAEAVMEWLVLPDRRHEARSRAADGAAEAIDGLTQLGGHRAFHEAAAAAAADPTAPFAVLVVEVDGVRGVNERDGYPAGDRLLVTVARRLQRSAARAGLAAYRDGGCRFGIVVPGQDVEGARRLLQQVNGEFALGPAVRLAAAVRRAGQDGDAVIAAARRDLHPVSAAAVANLDKAE